MTSETNRSGDVISQLGLYAHTLSLISDFFGKRTHFQILTSRSVIADCHEEVGSGRLRHSGLAALFLLSDRNYLIDKSEPVENGLQRFL